MFFRVLGCLGFLFGGFGGFGGVLGFVALRLEGFRGWGLGFQGFRALRFGVLGDKVSGLGFRAWAFRLSRF